jgi:hypothetical protein
MQARESGGQRSAQVWNSYRARRVGCCQYKSLLSGTRFGAGCACLKALSFCVIACLGPSMDASLLPLTAPNWRAHTGQIAASSSGDCTPHGERVALQWARQIPLVLAPR